MRTPRVADALRGRKKAVMIGGAAAALLGAGTASVATVASASAAPAHVQAAALATTTAKRGSLASARPVVRVRTGAKPEAAGTTHTWARAQEVAASQTSSAEPKAADQLQPVGTSGPQTWMPISGAQLANATTIVRQALNKHLGVRSAVIAVATSMQESTLNNINYGTSDSLGLFQQQPSCGWGSAEQIMQPSYAADAFLTALQHYQSGNPGWVSQPLWQTAQGVQGSEFPMAYAKWEAQAAQLVKSIVTQMN
jgi:hypothetical protein